MKKNSTVPSNKHKVNTKNQQLEVASENTKHSFVNTKHSFVDTKHSFNPIYAGMKTRKLVEIGEKTLMNQENDGAHN